MAISNLGTGLRPGVCTSTTRPTTPYEGQHIYETDTDIEYVWNGTAWLVLPPTASPTFTGGPAAPTATAGTNTTQLATTAFVTTAAANVTSGFRNKIINGDMRIDQRNSAATAVTTNDYSADLWYNENGCNAVLSAQQSTDVPTGQGFFSSLKVTSTTGDASIGAGQFAVITQHIEGSNSAALAYGSANAKQIVVSFWVKATVTGTYSLTLYNNGATRILPTAYTVSVSNTWEKKTVVIAGDTSGTWLTTTGRGVSVNFYTALGSTYLGTSGVWNGSNIYGATGQANAWASNNNVFAITGVQLEEGGVATPFEYRPIGVELALCQRYYYRVVYNGSGNTILNGTGVAYSAGNQIELFMFNPVQMRTTPQTLETANIGASDLRTADSGIASVVTGFINNSSPLGFRIRLTATCAWTGTAFPILFSGGYLALGAQL